jgi:hypothetical protein
VGLSTAYSPEYRDTQSNRYLMTQLALADGGRVDPPASAAFGGERPGVWAAADLTPLLLLLAMLLLPFDIAVRRLAIDWQDVRRAVAWVAGKRARAPKPRAATPELGRLLDRKESVVSAREEAVPPPERSVSALPSRPAPTGSPSSTLRPERPEPVSSATVAAPPASDPEPQPEEGGMSRLLAAKRRAQQRREEE